MSTMGMVVAACGSACGRVEFAELFAIDASPSDALQCPSTFRSVSGQCYRFSAATEQWLDAEQQCEATAGAHLAVVDDPAEAAVILSLQIDEVMWIGASDRIVEGDYRTVTGQSTYVSWLSGFPKPPDDCVEISGTTGSFKTLDCTTGNQFLCEWDGRLVVPANF